MAIIATNLTAGGASGGGSSATTASISPNANQLVVVVVGNQTNSGSSNGASISGNGISWTQLESLASTAQSGRFHITVFVGYNSSPTAGTISITFGGQTQQHIAWGVAQLTNAVLTDTYVQQNSAQFSGSGSTSVSTTLSAFASSLNGALGALYSDGGQTVTAGSGFSLISSGIGAGGAYIIFSGTPQTNVEFDYSSFSGNELLYGFEFKGQGGGGFFYNMLS